MESIMIIVAGLIFSVISKSVKDKQKIEKERKKRKDQLSQGSYTTRSAPERSKGPEKKQKSLKDIFMEELDKVGDEDGGLGDIFRRTLGEEPQKEIQAKEIEASNTSYDYKSKETDYTEAEHLSNLNEDEYRKALEERIAAYMEPSFAVEDNGVIESEIAVGESKIKSGIVKKTKIGATQDNRKYNPFTRSLNRKDVIRGIIFSEVLDKPKSMRNERRSM